MMSDKYELRIYRDKGGRLSPVRYRWELIAPDGRKLDKWYGTWKWAIKWSARRRVKNHQRVDENAHTSYSYVEGSWF